MVTPQEAEELAQSHIEAYLNECNLDSASDAGNALMKLCSIAGVMMCASVGHKEAVDRLIGTAAFIEKTMHGVKFQKQKVH